jgi:hypothetical protein
MARKSHTISSMAELFQAVPKIIEAANADPAIALRFAANPLLLAEDMGYTLTEEMKHFAGRRVRFSSAKTFERLVRLEKQVWELAGEHFDIDSSETLAHILFTKMKLPVQPKKTSQERKKPKGQAQALVNSTEAGQQLTPRELTTTLPARVIGHELVSDPLERLRGTHPIMPLLLEYRQLEASMPRLAPREVYDRISRGDVHLPITQLKLRLKKIPKL